MLDPLTEIIESANALSAIIEASTPRRGLNHPRHRKTLAAARAKVEQVMRSYFRRQEEALLAEVRPKITAARGMYAEARSVGGKRFANGLLPSSLHPLRFPVTSAETDDYNDAITDAIAGAAKTLAKELAVGATISDDVAGRYLRDNSLTKLTGGFSDTTIQRLRDAVADAWDAGGSYDQVVGAIKGVFDDFSDTRAGLIAQTEVNDAYNHGRVELANEAGFDEKAWDPDGEACEEICQPNVDQGWIGIDDDFDSGDDAPPAHPNCDCSISFRKGAESPEDEEERWGAE